MSEGREDHPSGAEGEPDELDDSVRDLLKGALGAEPEPRDVLSGVQKKLRDRSGGKFYADEWSTAKRSPTMTFLVTSALMLVIVLVTYAILAPLRGRPERVGTDPVPIEVLPPPMHS